MTGGPGSVWGYIAGDESDLIQFEVDEEGLSLWDHAPLERTKHVLTLDADQARLLYEAMHKYYSEEAS